MIQRIITFHSPRVSQFSAKTDGKQTKADAEIYAEIQQEERPLKW